MNNVIHQLFYLFRRYYKKNTNYYTLYFEGNLLQNLHQ